MPKARASITVYSSARISGLIFEDESMKGPRLNFHAERELEHPKTTFFSSFLQLQQYTHVRRRRVVCL